MGDELSLLLIEDNPGDARLIRELLREAEDRTFHLEHVPTLQAGLSRLAFGDVAVVLTDLNLPDSARLDTYVALRDRAPEVPAVILTTVNDGNMALEAVRHGAQDYLIKGEIDGDELVSALRYAVERHRSQQQLQHLARVDELTGLYNRRGFRAAAEQHLELCRRTDEGFLLLFIDVDNLKRVNDSAGHAAGDEVLKGVARALRETFRASDVLGRWGGDEFVAIATNADEHDKDRIIARLTERIKDSERRHVEINPCSLSLGSAYAHPDRAGGIDELIAEADAAMYRHRHERTQGESS